MTEFEFDKKSAERIEKTIRKHNMCLKNCADILELLAPLCDMWSPQGLQRHIQRVFSAQFIVANGEMSERVTMYDNARQIIANEVSQFLQDAGFEDASKAVDCEFEL